jgi:peptide subunit release factor 1 (eRF1)
MYDDALEHRVDGAVYVDGSECVQYLVQDGYFKQLDRFDIRLISQFKNGGQSANRLERIVDENRNVFVQKVVSTCIQNFYDKQENRPIIVNLILYGPSRFKDDVISYKKSKLSKYFKNIELFTTPDSNPTDEIIGYLDQIIDPVEEKNVLEIQEQIQLADSRLEFGDGILSQLEECMLERIILIEEMYEDITSNLRYEPEIVIVHSDKYRSWLQTYGGMIGVRWY